MKSDDPSLPACASNIVALRPRGSCAVPRVTDEDGMLAQARRLVRADTVLLSIGNTAR